MGRVDWRPLTDVRIDFAHADIVGHRTVFNIHGNHCRLVAGVNYATHGSISKSQGKRLAEFLRVPVDLFI